VSIITISRQIGSLGDEVALSLSSKLGWECITRESLIERFFNEASPAEKYRLAESAKYYLSEYKDGHTYRDFLEAELMKLAEQQSAILLGFGSQLIFSDHTDAINVRITAPEEVRLSRIRHQYRMSVEEATNLLTTTDRHHKRFVSQVFLQDSYDPMLYHLTLNTAYLSVDECVAAIIATYNEHNIRIKLRNETETEGAKDHQTQLPVFKNPAEAEFAHILDMYHIDWKYEPKTFPVEWDENGQVTLAFSPDFYLTKFDTYLELTTMNQKYVTEKNKKLRKVRELYPGVNVKIVYKNDFYSLVERFKH